MGTSFSTLYVSRTVALPVSHVAQAFDLFPATITQGSRMLVLDRGSELPATGAPGTPWRCVRASLRPGGLRPAFAVEVEAAPWSHHRTEIGIRPNSRRCLQHPTSFCAAAHVVIDHLAGPFLIEVLRKAEPANIPERGRLGCMINEADAVTVVKLTGDLNQGTVAHLRDELSAPMDAGPKHVRVDLAQLRSLDRFGLAEFVVLARTVERGNQDTSVTFASPPDPIRRVIEHSGFAELLSVE